MEEVRVVNGYVQNKEGKWVLTDEAKSAAKALYYSNRVAYDTQDPRHMIGRYSPDGELIRFTTRHGTKSDEVVNGA